MPSARSPTYRQHHPEDTPLYWLVEEHLPSFLAAAEQNYRGALPNYVREEFKAYSRCGIFAHGFARARCQSCGDMLLVAFSCKKRGICPSCNARRMADTAARLVDRVLPDVRLRQWVLSVPFELRLLLAKKPDALSALGRIFIEEIFRFQRELGARLGLARSSSSAEQLRGGAICFPQRFGSSLNLNVHYHVIVPDALFYRNASGRVQMEVLRRPSRSELEDLTYNVTARCMKWLRKHECLTEPNDNDTPMLLDVCLQSSVGLGALAVLGRKGNTQRPRTHKSSAISYKVRGGTFNIHVGDAARGREEREQLIRYCARAPLSLERLSVSEDGKVVYQLKHPIAGRTHRVMEPHQFLARLCALIPPPRHPLIRFHGVFGPASKWRADVVPQALPPSPNQPPDEQDALDRAHHAESRWQSQRLDWATLLKRVYNIDALRCPCGGEIRFEELIESPEKACAFLDLHEIESPRPSSSQKHIQTWSDAPNIALAWGRVEAPTDIEEGTTAKANVSKRMSRGPNYPDKSDDFHDILPSDEVYFVDVVPPD